MRYFRFLPTTPRRRYNDDVELSILGFGGIVHGESQRTSGGIIAGRSTGA
jgi:hypothetical protein